MTVGDQEYGLDLTRTGRVGSGAIMTLSLYNGEYGKAEKTKELFDGVKE